MATKLPHKSDRNAVVYYAKDADEALKVFQHAQNMAGPNGPLNGISVVGVPDTIPAGDLGSYSFAANDYKKQGTLVIAVSPEVKLKKMLRRSETVPLADALGLKELPALSGGELYKAEYESRAPIDIEQQVVIAAAQALGSGAVKGGTLGSKGGHSFDTGEGEHWSAADDRSTKWSTQVDHTGKRRPDYELDEQAQSRRRELEGGRSGRGGNGGGRIFY